MRSILKILIIGNDETEISKIENQIVNLDHQHLATIPKTDHAWFHIFTDEPNLIILSSKAEGSMSANEFVRKINFLNIPILILYAGNEDSNTEFYNSTPDLNVLKQPFEVEDLIEAINQTLQKKYLSQLKFKSNSSQEYLFLKKNDTHEKVYISDILFIKSEGNYCATNVANGEKYINRISLSEISSLLNSKDFKKSHRSYLVNINKIDSINLSQSIIKIGTSEIPISRNAKSYFLNSYKVIN